ncbi:MAG: D-alanine--D-alanine ligase, partial [Epsilonproteobacteria bacterium]|nr:D-alanine--D-alanine ligase [Campylobacterota bacterium]
MKLIILFGGASFEHEISIVSAITVKEKLQNNFELEYIFCDQDHTFYQVPADKMKSKTFSTAEHKKFQKLQFSQGCFSFSKMFSKGEIIGTVLNLIHGADGEDGTISSLLDFYNISYIGPRTDASVFSYDKRYTKMLAKEKGINYIKYEILNNKEQRDIEIPLPVIVKPVRLGSSIGVSIVKEMDELDYALDVAYEFDSNVIVEPFIEGVKEYNLAGYFANGALHYSIVEEPQKQEFLDFEKKYMDFSRSSHVSQADISDELEIKLQNAFKTIYTGMFEGALIRCDFFVIENEVYLNEINPIPGSMANYLFDDFSNVIEDLANSLPQKKRAQVTYEYIDSISKA